MGHRVINDAYYVIHQGFFHGKRKQPSTLKLIIMSDVLMNIFHVVFATGHILSLDLGPQCHVAHLAYCIM